MNTRMDGLRQGALVALLAGALTAGAAEPAPPPTPESAPLYATEHATEHASSWWSWWPSWSWGNGSYGLVFGGVTYGDGANQLVGSDRLVHQLRTINGVRAIELRGPIDIVIKQGQVEKLTLHTDDNVAPLIETPVDDGVLRIGVQPGASFRTRHPVGVTVEVLRLNAIKVLGSGDVTCAQFDSELMEISVRGSGDVRMDALHTGALAVLIQGSGDVHLSGTAPKQGYVIEGSGDVSAEELTGRNVAVRIAGSGDAKVWATETLTIDIAGSGDVTYHGQPALTKSVHGSGDIVHVH
jgi:hypothetical protein